MAYSVVDENDRLYAIAPTFYEAWNIVQDLVALSGDDNWHGLRVVLTDEEVDEIIYM